MGLELSSVAPAANQDIIPRPPAHPEAATCSFLDKLSAEIRVQIYGHVFGEATHVRPAPDQSLANDSNGDEESSEASHELVLMETSIMATNKQIHEEAAETFYNKKIIRLTFAQLDMTLEVLESGNTHHLDIVRRIDIVECKSARVASVHYCLFRLHLLPHLKSLVILTEYLTTMGHPDLHWTAQHWATTMGLPPLICVDVGKFKFKVKKHTKLEKVWLMNSKLVRMWPSVKSTPEDYNVADEADKIINEWSMSGYMGNFVAWASHTSLRMWVALHEEVVALGPDPKPGRAYGREAWKWARTTVEGTPPLTHLDNALGGDVPMHALSPQDDPARLEAATEFLAMNIATCRILAPDPEFDYDRDTFMTPSWTELGGVDAGAWHAKQHQIGQQWLRDNMFIEIPWIPGRQDEIEFVIEKLADNTIYGPVFGVEKIRNASKKTLQEMWYFSLAMSCKVPDDSTQHGQSDQTSHDYGYSGPRHLTWATSHLRKYLELSNHFVPSEDQFTSHEITNASFKTLRKTFSFVISVESAFAKYLGRSEPDPFEMTEEMEQEVNIYWPFLSHVASSLRGFYDLVEAAQHMHKVIDQENDEAHQDGHETDQKGDETNQECDETDQEGEENQTGCVMA
ncbi:hypothetical protein CKM354_000887500 [Cercospora kikuchii]|uniref:Uncharacterized protein n=1 Tax=Cercospora kikuchii TaxID=84275 RepID=A0A9P3FK01_9PEZI|nr:uncharacterized protein CKM354_000887500 [Cercospora kikuchii]GIZ45720.1 hypothetical protein CKM354_000887500 [Cercospora kikuchii]